MTKERIILAIVAIVAGLIVASSTFFFYQKKETFKDLPKKTESEVTSSNGKSVLEIESPQHESITDKKSIEIKGKTQVGALLVLTTNTEDFVFTASEDGSFSKKVNLIDEENLLTVTAYPENGTSITRDIAITYTTEEF